MIDPEDIKYVLSHEWARLEDNGEVTVGITEHAQDQLGDIVFVELPQLDVMTTGQACMVIESVKSASDIHMPIAGKIIAINDALEDEPELINTSPYDEGWLFKVQPNDVAELATLPSLQDYQTSLDA